MHPPSTSSSSSARTIPQQTCAVCDRRAEGRHYGVTSCSACKSFFRRSIAYKRKYECKFNRNCSMQRNGQTLCRSCRFQRCHSVGMDPIGIYDYTVKKSLQNQTSMLSPSTTIEEFKEQILSSYSILVHDRKQQIVFVSNFSKTMQNVSHENLIFKQFLINTQLMEYFHHAAVKKKRGLRSWCVLQLLHNTVKSNGLSQNRIYHFDGSYTLLTQEGFLSWYNSSTILFPHKSSIQRLSESAWKRVVEIIKHFENLNLNDFEMANFLILAIATTSIINSSNPKEVKNLMTSFINRIIGTVTIYNIENMKSVADASIRIGNLLMFLPNFVEVDSLMNEFFLQLSLYCKTLPELFDFDE